jgi:hypothetical protein
MEVRGSWEPCNCTFSIQRWRCLHRPVSILMTLPRWAVCCYVTWWQMFPHKVHISVYLTSVLIFSHVLRMSTEMHLFSPHKFIESFFCAVYLRLHSQPVALRQRIWSQISCDLWLRGKKSIRTFKIAKKKAIYREKVVLMWHDLNSFFFILSICSVLQLITAIRRETLQANDGWTLQQRPYTYRRDKTPPEIETGSFFVSPTDGASAWLIAVRGCKAVRVFSTPLQTVTLCLFVRLLVPNAVLFFTNLAVWGETESTRNIGHYLAYCISPGWWMMMMSVEQSVEWLAGETESLGGDMPQNHYIHYKSRMTWPGIEPGSPL